MDIESSKRLANAPSSSERDLRAALSDVCDRVAELDAGLTAAMENLQVSEARVAELEGDIQRVRAETFEAYIARELRTRLTPRPMDSAPRDGTPVLIQLGAFGDPTDWKWCVLACAGAGKVWTLHGWHSGEATEEYCQGWLPLPTDQPKEKTDG